MAGGEQTPPGERLLTAMALEERVTAEWWGRWETWLELTAERKRAGNGTS